VGRAVAIAIFAVVCSVLAGIVANWLTPDDGTGRRRTWRYPAAALVLAVVAGAIGLLLEPGSDGGQADTGSTSSTGELAVRATTTRGTDSAVPAPIALAERLGDSVANVAVAGLVHPGAGVWQLSGIRCPAAQITSRLSVPKGFHHLVATIGLSDRSPSGVSVQIDAALGDRTYSHIVRAGNPATIDLRGESETLTISLAALTSTALGCDDRSIEVVVFDASLS
jgi:hypothetical protein